MEIPDLVLGHEILKEDLGDVVKKVLCVLLILGWTEEDGVKYPMFVSIKSEIRTFFSFPAFLPFSIPTNTFSVKNCLSKLRFL